MIGKCLTGAGSRHRFSSTFLADQCQAWMKGGRSAQLRVHSSTLAESSLHAGTPITTEPSTSESTTALVDASENKGVATLTDEQLRRNAELLEMLQGKLVLAPLTKGGNLPFRRLCADFGAEVTMSEMSFARHLLRGDPTEKARLKRAANEACFGFQIATNNIGEGVRAGALAAEAGASWMDLNCGCPIYEATKRGLGSALLRNPRKLARLVAGIAEGIDLPLTVKVRTGTSASKINVQQVVSLLQDAGAAAVIVHGRTAEQRYKKPADWSLLADVARLNEVPVIGNGDILTYYEAQQRRSSGCLAHMVGRGALIKPWIFQEVKEGRELNPDATERVGIYRQLVSHMKEHFGDDAKGRRKAFYFLPWHFDFLCRYRYLPEEVYRELSEERPLIGQRMETAASELGEELDSLPVLERLLRCQSTDAHAEIAAALWDSSSDAEARGVLEQLANEKVADWESNGEEREERVAEG
ncbi:g6214 [Coccomyxa elongata]